MTITKKKSTKMRVLSKPILGIGLLTLTVLSLSACNSTKQIFTEDNSKDYMSAKELPPLKKPKQPVVASKKSTSQEFNTQEAESIVSSIEAKVITTKSNGALLEIVADFDSSWKYLTAKLKKTDITVFSRNKSAGRFSIGCSDITATNDESVTVVKSGRWSFFNRSKQENLEYCALQVVSKKGTTIVSVLNRAGENASNEHSINVFNRIINN